MSDTVTLRDTFAAAALSGLLASDQYDQLVTPADYAGTAYELADAMLRERASNHPEMSDSCPASTPQAPRKSQSQIRLECWQQFGSGRWGLGVAIDLCDLDRRVAVLEKMIHDAAPAARASLPADDHASGWSCSGGLPRCGAGTGTPHSAPACDGADALSTPDSGGPINRAAHGGQSPARSGESERRDAPQPDNGGAGGPAHDTQEPVAWAVVRPDDAVTVVVFRRSDAGAHSTASDRVIPLYRQPRSTLTDAEREAVSMLACACETSSFPAMAKTLRGLLERTKGGGE